MKTLKSPADLRQMIEAATPGPWNEDDGIIHSQPLSDLADKFIALRLDGKEPDFARPDTCIAHFDQFGQPEFQENADLICALRNQAPAILAMWEAAQAVSNYPRLASHIGSDKAEALRAALAGMGKP